MQARRIQATGPQAIIEAGSEKILEGEVVILGDALVGVATREISATQFGSLETGGLFDFALSDGVSLSAGDEVFWSPTSDPLNGGAAGSGAATDGIGADAPVFYLGRAVNDATNASTDVVRVLLAPAPTEGLFPTALATSTEIITSPRSARLVVDTSGGSQALILGVPSVPGQELLIYMKAHGGDCVISSGTSFAHRPIDQSGHWQITLDDEGDSVRLVAIEIGANLRWRLVYNDGCTLG